MTARGIRNNNPLNIEARANIQWKGLAAASEMTPEQRAERRFCVFRSAVWGIRAGVLNFQAYLRRDLDTVREIISSWAPPSDNNPTENYIREVAAALDVPPDQVIDTTDPSVLLPLLKAMIRVENGEQPYTDEMILEGVTLALGPAAPAAPAKTPTRKRLEGLGRHSATLAAGVAFAVALGLVDQDQAEGLEQASATLLSEANIEALGVALGALAGVWAVLRSWFAPEKAQD